MTVLYFANIFQPLIDVFEAVIKFFHNSVGVPWGWAIVLLTVCVRAVLLPLTIKQFSSMRRLQQLQPQMKALQAKYKEDKQRQQQELMKFYKENHINPLASCLPLVAQLPVFISLFYMLRKSLRNDICPQVQVAARVAARAGHHVGSLPVACGPHGGASFLFIPDLTNHASGIVLIVLIVLYIGTQVGSSLMSMSTTDSSQKWLMLGLPLFFVVFVIQFPAGVIVYWITTNTWTILQQYIVLRRVSPPPAPATGLSDGPGGSPGGPAPGGGSGRSSPNGTGGGSDRPAGADGSGGGALAGILRNRQKGAGSRGVATTTRERRSGPPPPSPRKKKKRSGRRR